MSLGSVSQATISALALLAAAPETAQLTPPRFDPRHMTVETFAAAVEAACGFGPGTALRVKLARVIFNRLADPQAATPHQLRCLLKAISDPRLRKAGIGARIIAEEANRRCGAQTRARTDGTGAPVTDPRRSTPAAGRRSSGRAA